MPRSRTAIGALAAGALILPLASAPGVATSAADTARDPAPAGAKQRIRSLTPAPGRLVAVSGFRGPQHLWCLGTSRPGQATIVVISGAGDFSLSWATVQRRLAQDRRICTYDRASLGWSARSKRPRTGRVIVRELQRLLSAGGVRGDIVLLAHSMGGIYARMFAAEHSRRVRGVVLVDPGDEHLGVRISGEARSALRSGIAQAARSNNRFAAICARGVYARHLNKLPLDPSMPKRDARTYRRLQAGWCRTWRGAAAEGLDAMHTWRHARAMSLGRSSLGDRPLVVLVSDEDLQFVADPVLNAEILSAWRDLQRQQPRLSRDSRFRVARHSSHGVMLDRPDSVVSATRWVLRRAAMPPQ